MSMLTKKASGECDETRSMSKGKVEIFNVGGQPVMRATFEPGWRWSECVKPIVKTEACQVHHRTYVISGRLAVRMEDGTTTEFGPGDFGEIPPGHDAWVVGKKPCVTLDFQGAAQYAKPAT